MEGKPYTRRVQELEERFSALEPRIPEGPEKEGLSVLHGILQELWRNLRSESAVSTNELSLQDIIDLHKTAPPMEGEAENRPLAVGITAPDLQLEDANGRLVSLSDYRGKAVVLVFYPLDWSPTCSDQLSLYQMESDRFATLDAQILGISVDSIYSHGAWAAVRGLTFPLLADFHPKGAAARTYGVWRDHDGFSERALFVIDGRGTLCYSHVSPRLNHIPDIYDLFRVLGEIKEAMPQPASLDT